MPIDYNELEEEMKKDPHFPKDFTERMMKKVRKYGEDHGRLAIWEPYGQELQRHCGECNMSEIKFLDNIPKILETIEKCHGNVLNDIENSGASRRVVKRYLKEGEDCYKRKQENLKLDQESNL